VTATPAEADWYVDFISPYVHLQAEMLAREPLPVRLRVRPVLFAGLLERWGHKGPAEIPGKRTFTFRNVVWRAHRLGLTLRAPPYHPFNPLRLLRLAVVLEADFDTALALSRFVWRDGRAPDDDHAWRELTTALSVADADARIADPEVKARLRENGERAIAQGVFGVPTLVIGGQLFWGADATDMARDWLAGAPVFASEEMQRADTLPEGRHRPSRPMRE
jgi:2-hydroxychromene-2-carboxylate isomerase